MSSAAAGVREQRRVFRGGGECAGIATSQTLRLAMTVEMRVAAPNRDDKGTPNPRQAQLASQLPSITRFHFT